MKPVCTCPSKSTVGPPTQADGAGADHLDTCPIFRQETYEANVLAARAFEVLRGASNARVAATALHVTMTKLAEAMRTTPVTFAETILRIARDLHGPVE